MVKRGRPLRSHSTVPRTWSASAWPTSSRSARADATASVRTVSPAGAAQTARSAPRITAHWPRPARQASKSSGRSVAEQRTCSAGAGDHLERADVIGRQPARERRLRDPAEGQRAPDGQLQVVDEDRKVCPRSSAAASASRQVAPAPARRPPAVQAVPPPSGAGRGRSRPPPARGRSFRGRRRGRPPSCGAPPRISGSPPPPRPWWAGRPPAARA